jgi:hypothetical protein
VRDSIVPNFADRASGLGGDVFDTLGTFEQIAVAMEKNVSLHANTLPSLSRWQAELVVHDLLHRTDVEQMFQTFGDVSGLIQDVPGLVDQIAAEASAIAASEREIVLDDVERQRLHTLDVLSEEVETTRQLLVEELETTRRFVTETREEALVQADEILERAVVQLEQPILRVVDHVLLRLLQGLLVALVALPFVLRIYRRIVLGPVRA